MTKPVFRKAAKAGAFFVVSLFVALFLYPREHVTLEAIYLLHPLFTTALSAGMLYTLFLVAFYDVIIRVWRARPGRELPSSVPAFIGMEKLCAVVSLGLFVIFIGLALHMGTLHMGTLHMGTLHVLYWQVVPIMVCIWLLCLAMEVAGQLCAVSRWGFMRYIYIGMLGCVSALSLYYNLVGAVPLTAVDFFAEYMQPIYVGALMAAASWRLAAIQDRDCLQTG